MPMETVRKKDIEYLAETQKGKLVPVEFLNYRAAKLKADELGPEWYPVLKSQHATYEDFSLPESKRSGGARVAKARNSQAILAAREIPEPKTLDELLQLHGYPTYYQILARSDDEDDHTQRMQQIEDRIASVRHGQYLPFKPCPACGERRLGCWSGDGLVLCANQPRINHSQE